MDALLPSSKMIVDSGPICNSDVSRPVAPAANRCRLKHTSRGLGPLSRTNRRTGQRSHPTGVMILPLALERKGGSISDSESPEIEPTDRIVAVEVKNGIEIRVPQGGPVGNSKAA